MQNVCYKYIRLVFKHLQLYKNKFMITVLMDIVLGIYYFIP